MKTTNNMGTVFLIVLIISAIVGGFAWTYSINAWLAFYGKEQSIVFWQGMLLGCCPIIGKLSVVVAVITWIAFLFI